MRPIIRNARARPSARCHRQVGDLELDARGDAKQVFWCAIRLFSATHISRDQPFGLGWKRDAPTPGTSVRMRVRSGGADPKWNSGSHPPPADLGESL